MSYLDDTHWCGAKPGEPHKEWDDVARCYISGQQLIACDDYWLYDEYGNEYPNPEHQCHPSIWDGDYPGVMQCQKYGLFAEVIQLDKSYKTSEDLNTLYQYGVWNIETQQHEIPEETLKRILEERGLQV